MEKITNIQASLRPGLFILGAVANNAGVPKIGDYGVIGDCRAVALGPFGAGDSPT